MIVHDRESFFPGLSATQSVDNQIESDCQRFFIFKTKSIKQRLLNQRQPTGTTGDSSLLRVDNSGGHCELWDCIFSNVDELIDLATADGVQLREPGQVLVELLSKSAPIFIAVACKSGEPVGFERPPPEKDHRTFMHEIHHSGINGDTSRFERSDGCGRDIEANEMNADIAIQIEGLKDRQPGGERAIEGVNKHVDRLARMFGKRLVNGLAVEVGPVNVAFKLNVICCLSHSCDDLHRKLTAIY